jgi:hypothetical protein
MMTTRSCSLVRKRLGKALLVTLLLVLVAITPFVAVLEVHHALGAVDQDGHQHSDSDLCQWVQHHAGSSLQAVLPSVASVPAVTTHELPVPALLVSSGSIPVAPARAPPDRLFMS